MKKFFIVSIITNILLSFLAFYGFIHYLVLSASNSFSSQIDFIVLLGVVILDVLINYGIFRSLKQREKTVFVLIPSSIFMLVTGLLFFLVK